MQVHLNASPNYIVYFISERLRLQRKRTREEKAERDVQRCVEQVKGRESGEYHA